MKTSKGWPGRKKVVLIGHAAAATLNFRAPLIADLVAAGCLVTVLAPDWTPNQLARLQALGATGHTFPLARTGLNPLQDLRSLWALWRRLDRMRPDVVMTYAAKTNVWGMIAAWLTGVPSRVAMVEGLGYAFTHHGRDRGGVKRRALRTLLVQLYQLAFSVAHKVVVLNPDDLQELKHRCDLSLAKAVVVNGIGVPLDEWPLHAPHTDPLTFTLVARLLREKGVMEFLQAAKHVKAEYPTTRFWLLGPLDDNPGALREKDLHPWLSDGTVEWPGAVDVKPWLAQTSVFVLPSYREGVPRSTQEAMAMGRPVITTDAPGCRETVVDGVNGFLVRPRDVEDLTRAMLRFVENPLLVPKMGQESRRLAQERFDVRQTNAVIMQAMGLR